MEALVDLEGFQGKGAEAIKGFYRAQIDVVNEWIHLIEKNIAFLKGIPGTAEDFDLGGGNTVVEVPFLEEVVKRTHLREGNGVGAALGINGYVRSNLTISSPCPLFQKNPSTPTSRKWKKSGRKRLKKLMRWTRADRGIHNAKKR
jgi:hypothetical protein